jgi:polysaccharide pyruvyl transferase WcaK-like protein
MRITRRDFVAGLATLPLVPREGSIGAGKRLLLRSSWQTVNIGDIAHTPGMLAALERDLPEVEVTLWPSRVDRGVEKLLRTRFPRLRIAQTADEQAAALRECDICLHGSGPGLVGARELERWRATGKPYGFGGVTLNDSEITGQRDLLAGAAFVFCRDTDSLKALQASGLRGPTLGFGPDATFALDLADSAAAEALLKRFDLEPGRFLCVVPRLRYTPYWKEGRRFEPAEIARREAENAAHAEADHAKLRAAIVAWTRETHQRVLLCPEMTYQVDLLRPLLFEALPEDVKPSVSALDRYWLTAEAASVYARASAVLSCELHSPIMAVVNGTPAVHVRQPTDTRKGQMWRDVGLGDWLFEVDQTTGDDLAATVLAIARDRDGARAKVRQAQRITRDHLTAMMKAIRTALETA